MFRASSTALLDSSDVFSMGRSGNSLLLVGTRDSEVRLFTRHDKGWKAANTSLSAAASDGVAVTSAVTGVEVHPERNMAIVTCSDGNVSLWHLGRRQLIHAFVEKEVDPQNLAQQREANNEVYVCKLRPGGGAFGTGGKDTLVRLYDEETLSQIAVLAAGAEDGVVRAHSSKVNALAWIDEHTVMSGGWDYTVQVWDTRQNRSIKSIYGPYLCADGIDIHPDGKSFVTASTRSTEQLQVWDVRTFEKTLDIPWPGSVDPAPTLMTARFSPGSGKYLAAGGSRDFRLFDVGGSSQRSGITPPQVCDALDPAFPVFALRWMAADELIVAGARTVALNLVH